MARYRNDDDRELDPRNDRFERERPWNYNDPYERPGRSLNEQGRRDFGVGRFGERADYENDEPRYDAYSRNYPQENLRRPESLRLFNVKDLERKANLEQGAQGDCFSLMFLNPRGSKLRAGQYEFMHFSLGTFILALNPVSALPNRYEVIINHLQR